MMKKVLIVDDIAFMRVTLKSILEENGFEVVGEAKNGIEGIQKYRELNPDIVTMDITMPVMDGINSLKEIKNINPNANIVMVSSMGEESVICEAVSVGANSFIVKPFNDQSVMLTLTKALKM